MIKVHHKGQMRIVEGDDWQSVADAMLMELGGPWNGAQGSSVERIADDAGPTLAETTPGEVHQPSAKRIERLHGLLQTRGVDIDASQQLFATGTRMLDVGHDTQAAKAKEHSEKKAVADVVRELTEAVQAECRRDVIVSASDFADKLDLRGALTFDGYKVREQTMRGLLARIESPALRFFLGVRDRIVETSAQLRAFDVARKGVDMSGFEDFDPSKARTHIANDKAELLDMLQRECRRFPDVQLKLRARDGLGDVFACVSPDYAPADAPDALRDVVSQLPDDTRATFSYDPISTAWELRAAVFTSTPADEQAVGEPFEAFASFRSRDNGTRGYTSGGGIILIRCWNASTYEAHAKTSRRRHVGRILQDVPAMVSSAAEAMHILTAAWGDARNVTIARPADDTGKLIPMELAIPGFFRHMLTARGGELVGVLPGRTEKHVKTLAMVYPEERRDTTKIVRADFAQAFTRYIQDQPTPIRRDAESAAGKWMVSGEPLKYAAA